jgi:hypothetical protein
VLFVTVLNVYAPEPDPLEAANTVFAEWSQELTGARERWNQRPFTDYVFSYEMKGADSDCIYINEVRDNEATFIENNGDHCGELKFTVDGIFDEIAQTHEDPSCFGLCQCTGYWLMHADYDVELGYPYNIDWSETGNDGFEPVDCPAPENRPHILPNSILEITPLDE